MTDRPLDKHRPLIGTGRRLLPPGRGTDDVIQLTSSDPAPRWLEERGAVSGPCGVVVPGGYSVMVMISRESGRVI